MKNINKVLILVALNSSLLYSWEINTHRAIDRCAIVNDKDCKRGDVAKNLHWFTENTGIKNESYYDEQLIGYTLPDGTKNITYFDYIMKGEPYIGISTWNQTFSTYVYTDLIEAGTILEDSLWSGVAEHITSDGSIIDGYQLAGVVGAILNAKDRYNSAKGRFNFHFYDAYTKEGLSNLPGTDNTKKLYGPNSSLLKWGFSKDTTILYSLTGKKTEHKNSYNYESALEYFKKGFIEKTSKDRKMFRAKMFVSIGYLLHLINDMNVPAHTRNDAHAPDDFEKWMREGKGKSKEGGFRIKGNTLSMNCSSFIKNAIKQVHPTKYSHSYDFAKEEGEFTGKHFFSEDSIHLDGKYKPITNLILPNFNNCNNGYISSLEDGKLATCRLSINVNNIVHPVKMKYNILGNNDYSVIEDNAKVLIPRAVANAEGFVNYFFRGRLKVSLDSENNKLILENISDKNLVANPKVCTFNSGMKVYVYYTTSLGDREKLFEKSLDKDIEIGQKYYIDNINKLLKEKDLDSSSDIVVVLEGKLGEEDGVVVGKVRPTIKANIAVLSDNEEKKIPLTDYMIGDSILFYVSGEKGVDTTVHWEIKNNTTGKVDTIEGEWLPSYKFSEIGSYTITLDVTSFDGSEHSRSSIDVEVASKLTKPLNLSFKKINSTKVKISWDSVADADGYNVYVSSNMLKDEDIFEYEMVYRATDRKDFQVISPDNSIDLNVEAGKEYGVIVEAYRGTRKSYYSKLLVFDTPTSNPDNTPPTANAGKDKKNISIDAEVHLSGKDSNDTEEDPLTYLWSFVSKPSNSSATLSDATIVNPTFTADEHGTYTIQLIVNDGFSNSSPDTVVIETDEEAPIKDVNPTSCTPEFD